ncbi:hypothetical protein L3Y34_017542 [Caenorhabditis briggsae]|uniref:Uncharacterized protein n=1 Tax=Caenorhabditis briggsae TaxID=6238 RepID=A0AAE9ITI6_CAEBR|nr:hypothetical protein L3Y34_017542 [Caenorhabditis briggsae]
MSVNFLRIRNGNMEMCLPYEYFVQLAKNLIRDQAPIGTNFSAGFQARGQKVMDRIQREFEVNWRKK